MTDKELIGKIKDLRKIQPSQDWLNLGQQDLIARINFEEEDEGLKANFGLFIDFLSWFKHPQSVALAVCLFTIFIGGPWLAVKASQQSLPGELLYSVKKVSEQVQVKVSPKGSKTQLQVEFAVRRLEELGKITDDSFTLEEKTEKAKTVANDFKNKLVDASINLDNITKEEAIAVAKKTKKIQEDLSKTKEEAPLIAQADLAEAEKTLEEINSRVLAVLTSDNADNTDIGEVSTSTDQEILIWLEEMEATSTDEGL